MMAIGNMAYLGLTALVLALAGPAEATEAPPTTPAVAVGTTDATHHSARVNGIRLHYVAAGRGEPVLLLPGWPQDWYAWRAMVPMMVARGRRVIVLDPRGFGDSDKPATGHDLDTAASDVHSFIAATGLARPGGIDVVTHDLGGWIGYALASAYPGDVRRLVLSEVTIPNPTSARPIANDAANVKTWHFGLNRLADLPEILVQGHERAYLTWLFDNKSERPWAITSEARDEYVRAFSSPGAARAGFDYYRELFGDAGLKRMAERLARPLPMPVLTVEAQGGVGNLLSDSLKGSASNLQGTILPGCGHYLPAECPSEFEDAIVRFWSATEAPAR